MWRLHVSARMLLHRDADSGGPAVPASIRASTTIFWVGVAQVQSSGPLGRILCGMGGCH